MEPEHIGDYEVVESLSRTPLSRLVQARRSDEEPPVAIKILLHDYRQTPGIISYFEREALCLAQFSHPNIARVLDCGVTEEGMPFLVMEFVNGIPLDKILRERPRPSISRVLGLALEAAEGLLAAFKKHVVHLDIKPGNLMVEKPAFRLKIVDFGLARQLWRPALSRNFKPARMEFHGTPRYMPPEQFVYSGLDHRCDIYSLGATFYHILSGQPPFDGLTDAELIAKKGLSRPIPLGEVYPDVPEDICKIIMRMMERDPNMRHQHYEELIRELEAAKLLQMAREAKSRKQ